VSKGVDVAPLIRSGAVWELTEHYLSPHHCFSQGKSPPSIVTPGQLARKNFASSHEVICEEYDCPRFQ
jgi:hypothetical protein